MILDEINSNYSKVIGQFILNFDEHKILTVGRNL